MTKSPPLSSIPISHSEPNLTHQFSACPYIHRLAMDQRHKIEMSGISAHTQRLQSLSAIAFRHSIGFMRRTSNIAFEAIETTTNVRWSGEKNTVYQHLLTPLSRLSTRVGMQVMLLEHTNATRHRLKLLLYFLLKFFQSLHLSFRSSRILQYHLRALPSYVNLLVSASY